MRAFLRRLAELLLAVAMLDFLAELLESFLGGGDDGGDDDLGLPLFLALFLPLVFFPSL